MANYQAISKSYYEDFINAIIDYFN